MINDFQKVFHSITKSLEVIYVLEGSKQCARIMVFEDELDKVLQFLLGKKLHVSASDFKVEKQAAQSSFYSDKSIKLSKEDSKKGHFFVYISKDKGLAEKAKLHEKNKDHKGLGIVLGYPSCCCDFFKDNFSKNCTDLTLKTLKNSEGFEFPFYNNIAARHFDLSLLNHFPHSFDCKESIEIAKNNLKIIQKHSPKIAEMFVKILNSAVIYTVDEGVILLRKFHKSNDELIYSDVLSTVQNKLFYLISSNKKLKISNKNSFMANDINIQGPNYGLMIFT